jgi:hypothetical protein
MVATPVLAPSLPGWDDEDVVPENLVTRLYSAGEDNAVALTAKLSPHQRALLAAYCYRRSHLHRFGLAIASTCDQATLMRLLGTGLGSTLFVQSRERGAAPGPVSGGHRHKITLAKCPGLLPPPLRLVVSEEPGPIDANSDDDQ